MPKANNNKNLRIKWNCKSSSIAKNSVNLIRNTIDNLNVQPNPAKEFIPLSIGDPTTFGNLRTAPEVVDAVKRVLLSGDHNGYCHATGFLEARKAVCDYIEPYHGKVTPNDVILCSGCSCSLDMCISVLAEPGQNILIPRPGFSIYRTLAEGLGIQVRTYNLIPEKNWEADIKHMESIIDENTAAIIVNNPSNPCGSVYSRQHLLEIIEVAENYYLPIIADEIYEHFVFPGVTHYPISSLSKNVPVLSCGGLTKRFLTPGWRMGWIIIHDRNNVFEDISKGLKNVCGRLLGSNSLVQAALPDILKNTPQKFFDGVVTTLYKHAKLAYDILKDVRGLRPIMPDGAMYMMIGVDVDNFPEYATELHFIQDLVREQSVFCLPGKCFDFPNYIRIVLTVPEELIREACSRIAEFCEQHYKIDDRVIENQLLKAVDMLRV